MPKNDDKAPDLRAELRQALLNLGVRDAIRETINGQEVELRPPTVKERGKMLKACGITGPGNDPDFGKMQAYALMLAAHHPQTGQRIFADTDLDALMDVAAGSELDELGAKALRFLNIDSDADEAKND